MRLASIDIGSNSIKLVVVEAAAGDSFAVLAREKDVVRLGHDTLRERHLSPAAINRGAETIKRFRSIAEARGVSNVVAVATASVREADNASEFVAEVARCAGVHIEILSGIEEARLIGLAASQGCAMRGQSVLNTDIGGGSTELSLMNEESTPLKLFSIKIGAVGLTETFVNSDPVKPRELRALRAEITRALERPSREFRGAVWQLATGTSGTALALAEVLKLQRARAVVETDGDAPPPTKEITRGRLIRFNERIATMNLQERRNVPGISGQRAEIIIAGGQILEGVMRALGIQRLHPCDWALGEGVVIDRLRQMDAESRPPVPDVADPRLRGVRAVGKRFEYEAAHAHHVASLAEKIFDSLAAPFKLSRHQRVLLSAAALLHDIGYIIAHEAHHKHSHYLIKHSELTGFSETERHTIANVARYHSRALPKERHMDFAALNTPERETIWRLGAILRVADALDRRHDARVADVTCRNEKDGVHLRLYSRLNCTHEIAAAKQKRDMFEQAFGCKLFIHSHPQTPEPHQRKE